MTEKTFSIQESLSFGWKTLMSRFWFFVGAAALVMVVQIVSRIFVFIPLLGVIVIFVVSILVSMGMVAFSLAAHDAPEHVEIKALWAPSPFWKFTLAIFAAALITVGPLVLLAMIWGVSLMAHAALSFGAAKSAFLAVLTIIAVGWAVYIGVRFIFVKYLVMDEHCNVQTALKKSYQVTQNNWLRLFGFVLLLGLINILGALALLVGLLVTIPLTLLAMAHAYRSLESRTLPASPVQNEG